jgi:ABC-type dipeptide/oligopeptide/nickel transport system ATPase component
MAIESTTALEVRGLVTSFRTPRGTLRAVDGLSLKVPAGKTLCIAGESGCCQRPRTSTPARSSSMAVTC